MKYTYRTGVIVPFVQKFYKQLILAVAGLFVASMATMTLTASAAHTVVVSDNTVDTTLGENGSAGWWFNRDASTSSPYEFTTDEASIGSGSLYVEPIDISDSDKFIAELFLFEEMGNLNGISYDFQIGPSGDASDENEFYMNVYTSFGESAPLKFYDCRYNVVPSTGVVGDWTTVTFDPTLAYPVTTSGSSPQTCPAVPADMGDDAHVRVIALNVGDTSANDAGVDGYLDNVVVDLDSHVTTYDFERAPNTGTISSPVDGSTVSGEVVLTASYDDGDDINDDAVQWAVRQGTCEAGTGAIVGNVGGNNDVASWDGTNFSYSLDTTTLTNGDYCFVFNPTDDAGENNVRVTSEFTVDNPVVLGSKDECKDGGWATSDVPVFKNQGHCVSHFASGGTSTEARNKNR